MGQRHTHVPVDRVGGQQRLGVHGVQVVDAVAELRREAMIAQGARDGVMEHHAAQAAHVDGALMASWNR